MKAKSIIIFFFFLLSIRVSAQWIQKSNFPGAAKAKSAAFTIGNKIYVMGGVDNSGNVLNDVWEYDIPSDTWLQKPNFPGPERYGAASFVLNNNGYIAAGGNDFGYLDDLWEFLPVSGTWIQRSGLPAGQPQHENQRREAFAFVIGNSAYLGGGDGFVFGPNSTSNIAFSDLWEYNPVNDSWQPKANIPDFIGRDMSIGVAMNGKGYVGLGCNAEETVNHQGFWEYDPVLDSWNSKSGFPTLYTVDAAAFVLDSIIYVVGGVNLNPVSLTSQFYKYDLSTDTWTALSNFNGGAAAGEFVVSTTTWAYVGTGYNGALTARRDLWKFTNVPTGISQNDLWNESADIYPNPFHDYISFNTKKNISSVELYNVIGAMLIKEENITNGMNVQLLPPGVYQAKLIFTDGSESYSRIIKSN
jgi:N-acetylneuraminic acid mutarotase